MTEDAPWVDIETLLLESSTTQRVYLWSRARYFVSHTFESGVSVWPHTITELVHTRTGTS